MLKYKDYTGKFEYDPEEDILFGRVIDTGAVITFYGSSIKEIRKAFQESVDTYLETCALKNIPPKKSFSGNIRLRVRPELHKQSFIAAAASGKSLNQFIQDALLHKIQSSRAPVPSSPSCIETPR